MPQLKRITWYEDAIERRARRDPAFDRRPCELDGRDLGLHQWLIVDARCAPDGTVTGFTVVDCDMR